jgi:hypothetical protein
MSEGSKSRKPTEGSAYGGSNGIRSSRSPWITSRNATIPTMRKSLIMVGAAALIWEAYILHWRTASRPQCLWAADCRGVGYR